MEWAQQHLGVEFVDGLNLPGIVRHIAENIEPRVTVVREDLTFLVNGHSVDHVFIFDHSQCLGNPVPNPTHLKQIAKAVRRIASWRIARNVHGVWYSPQGLTGKGPWRSTPVSFAALFDDMPIPARVA